MRYETIADIYSANEIIRRRLLDILDGLDNGGLAGSDSGAWSIADIVEHLAIVEDGTLKICTKLVSAAKESAKPGVYFSSEFIDKLQSPNGAKIEAPERVRPTGEQSLETSLQTLKECRAMFDALRKDL